MSVVSLRRKKLLYAIQLLQTPPVRRSFSSYKVKRTTQTKSLQNALRILDIVAPKKPTPSHRQNHLRLVQDLLQIDSDHVSNDFTSSNSAEDVPNVFDEILEYSVLNNEDSNKDPDTKRLEFDARFLSNALSTCASTRNLRMGMQYHCLAITIGFVVNAYVGSSLVSLYGKCGELENAYKLFDEMPVKNVVLWTAIISGFAQEYQVDVCLDLYSVMRNSKLKPNDFTFTSILSACMGSGALGYGRSAHCQIILLGFDSYLHIANSLVSMYCKCGNIEDALYIFKNMNTKDIVSWNSMIAGFAQHGLATQAIEHFERMKKDKVKPDAITFLGVLSSCRHAGLVEVGRKYFNSMVEYGVTPELDHYSCLVDLLGRVGLLEEARDVILRMPISPNAVIWGSLLSSCRLHGSVWLGIQAAENRLLQEPGCPATHVQLANLYASVRSWDQVAKVRKLMKDRGLRTNPGCSWIEIKNKVYRFRAEGKSNTKQHEILTVLDSLVDHMINVGCTLKVDEVDAFQHNGN